MNYKSIEILEKNGIFPTKIRIFMEDGTIEEIVASKENEMSIDNECFKKLQSLRFMESDKYETTTDFINNNPKVIEKLEEKKETPVVKEELEEIVVEEKSEKEESKKEKTVSKGIKITAIVVASLLGIYGVGYTLNDMFFNKKNNDTDKNDDKVNTTPIVTQVPIITTVNNNDPANEPFEERLEEIVQNEPELNETLTDIINGNEVSLEEMLKALSDQAAISLSNMTEVSKFINGSALTGNIILPEYGNLFANNIVDYAAVTKFNLLHNNIVYSAYNTKSISETNYHIEEFTKNFVDLVFAGKPFVYQNYDGSQDIYYFNDLSPMAKNSIIQMGMMVLTIEKDFNYNINGVVYNRQKCTEDISVISTELASQIINNRNNK